MLNKIRTGIMDIRKSQHLLLILILFSGFVLSQCSTTYEPVEESVSQILKALSSDDMRGRQSFTPDIELAAEFIENQFKQAGLNTLPELENFRQSFILKEISIGSAEVTFNGKNITDSKYFALLNGESINWNQGTVKTFHIKNGDNFREKFQEYSSLEENVVIIIDPSFSDIFGRYQAYFSRPNRIHSDDKSENSVFVLGDSPASFTVIIEPEIEEKELANIVGTIQGKRSNEYVLFSAHYDHIGIRTTVEGDSIANGANDNASGVTAVIELAKYFKSMGKPERTLIFATFTAEEMGGYGSQYFSRQFNPDEIVAMFNIEMIGKPAVSGPNTAWITGYERSDFGELLSKSAEGTIYEFYPDPYPQQNLFYRSDNATLARLGVPAHTISTTPIDVDKDYHQVSDEYQTINIPHLTNTIKAIAKAAEGIVSGKDTPTRVDTELVD